MKIACTVLLTLAVAAPGLSGQAVPQSGSVEFVARATPTGGRPESVLRFPFYLLRKSFAEIRKEAETSEPQPDLDRFVDALEVSKELKAWMKRTRMVQLTGSEFMQRVTVNDIFEVPEFFEAYLARNAGDVTVGFPKPKYRERDRERNPQKYERQRQEYHEQIRKFLETYPHSRDGMDLHLIQFDPRQRWAQQEAERRRRIRNRWLALAQTRYLVARTETDLEGRGGFTGIPPGEYWLSTLEGEATVGDARLRWDIPVTVRAGRAAWVELSNINAAQPEQSGR